MVQSLSIADLISVAANGTRLLAGSEGLQNKVLWAHSCELSEPHRWLGPSELLMTVGHCVPQSANDQVRMVSKLKMTGLSGMMIGDNQVCPDLHPEMLSEANKLGFPVLLTDGAVPFASIARMVAAANSSNQTQQILVLNKLYQSVLESFASPSEFVRSLETIFHAALTVVDAATGAILLPGSVDVDMGELAASGILHTKVIGGGSITRLASLGNSISAWKMPSRRFSILLVKDHPASILDSFTLTHLSQVMAGEANRRAEQLLAQAESRRKILRAALQGSDLQRAESDAVQARIMPGPLRLGVAALEDQALLFDALPLYGISHSSEVFKGHAVVLFDSAQGERIARLCAFHRIPLGVSKEFLELSEAKGAMLQAERALEARKSTDEPYAVYQEGTFSIVPRSESEATEIVSKILGPLLSLGKSGDVLVESLCEFLDADRNWKNAAEKLGIHRQTLAYRLNRIERLTGRSLKSSRDLAEFWVARVCLKYR